MVEYECKKCNHVFYHKGTYDRHQKTDCVNKPRTFRNKVFNCDKCDMTFHRSDEFNSHHKTHKRQEVRNINITIPIPIIEKLVENNARNPPEQKPNPSFVNKKCGKKSESKSESKSKLGKIRKKNKGGRDKSSESIEYDNISGSDSENFDSENSDSENSDSESSNSESSNSESSDSESSNSKMSKKNRRKKSLKSRAQSNVFYIVSTRRRAAKNMYKIGRHKGNKKKLQSRYVTYLVHPIIFFFHETKNAFDIEKMVKEKLYNHRIANEDGHKTEWVNLSLGVLFERVWEIIDPTFESSM